MLNKIKIASILLTLILAAGYYYVMLPPINLSSIEFYIWVVLILAGFAFFNYLFATFHKAKREDATASMHFKTALMLTAIIVLIVAAVPVSGIVMGPFFNADAYYKRIEVVNSDFSADVKEADFTHLPLLDKESSQKLGDRVLGQLPELISQFSVSEEYTQINYSGNIVRVTPLEYNGVIKYLNNRSEGTPGYITVNSTTGTAELKKLSQGMRYMPTAYLQEDLYRHVRFGFPFEVLGTSSFELDEEGNPFWIIQTVCYKGIGLRKEISGIIVVDPITGDMQKYATEEIPTWIDNVWDANLIIQQLNDWGKYSSGFLNAYMAQNGVSQTTEGYNYLTQDDDVYMYTGITSAASDESNIGFVLVNLRTKQASYYAVPGAEEYSAMESAKGQVQEKNYTATFPLLINLNDNPTYMLSLKDAAGLVKMYAFVDVQDYQKVTVTDSSKGISKAVEQYLDEYNLHKEEEPEEVLNGVLTIDHIEDFVIDGNSYLYLLTKDGIIYRFAVKSDPRSAFLQINDKLTVDYVNKDGFNEIVKLHEISKVIPIVEETNNNE